MGQECNPSQRRTCTRGSGAPPRGAAYRPRNPRASPLWQCVQRHAKELHDAGQFQRVVEERVIERFIECGDPHHGFARIYCDACGHDYLLAYSCKTRYFCPSCHQKRVLLYGEWVEENVLEPVAHRQYVFTLPRLVRHFFARRREWLGDLELYEVDGIRRVFIYDDISGGPSPFNRAYNMLRGPNWWVPNRGLFRAEAFHRIGGIQRHDKGEFSADWPWFERVPEILCQKFYKRTSLSRNWNRGPEEVSALRRSAIREIRRSDLDPLSKVALIAYMKLSHEYPMFLRLVPRPIKDFVRYIW